MHLCCRFLIDLMLAASQISKTMILSHKVAVSVILYIAIAASWSSPVDATDPAVCLCAAASLCVGLLTLTWRAEQMNRSVVRGRQPNTTVIVIHVIVRRVTRAAAV